jgi:hypothetical protein
VKILIACEESQEVCKAFRAKGHEAYSCDVQECSGGHPEWHIMVDVLPLLNGNCVFTTVDGQMHRVEGKWDMIIAFPPCTQLCSAGQHWFSRGLKDPALREEAVKFFMSFVNADCDRIAIENPVGIMSTRFRKPDQKIHPWMFGHSATKNTCLWLKNLPILAPSTDILEKPEGGWENQSFTKDGRYGGFVNYDENGKILAWNDPKTARIRSKTYPGIAKAMAEQWG